MEYFYRIRALVDSSVEELIFRGENVASAMAAFAKTEDLATGSLFEEFGIDVAMVHRIVFGESGPVFEDVTYQLDSSWARADFAQCLAFFKHEQKSMADHLVESVRGGFLTGFSKAEANELLNIGCVEEEEINNQRIKSTARIVLSGGGRSVLVQSPHKLAEGFVQFFTPLEAESTLMVPVSAVESLSFSE